jgi:DNA-binding NarL/FixJ family response regulator
MSASQLRPDAGAGDRLRVALADDDVLLREGIASVLREAGYVVVGQASDAEALMDLVLAEEPDLAVVDIRMPPSNTWEGIDVARRIRAEFPDIGVLLLSAHLELDTAMDVLSGGDRIGYLLKSRVTHIADLVDALERVAAGGSVIDPALVQELFARRSKTDPLARLTDREREVLRLVAEGRSNAGIARQLWVTDGAVEKHIRSILSKLDLPTGQDDHRRVLAVLAYLDNR